MSRTPILALATLALLATACAEPGTPFGPDTQVAATVANAKGAGTPEAAGPYDGLWVESPTSRFRLPDGTFQEVWVEFTLVTSKGAIGGSAIRYVSYYAADGTPVVVRRSLGTPGRVSATITAAGVDVGITKLAEPKLTIGYQLAANAERTVLTNLRVGGTATAVGFVRGGN